MKRYHQPLVLFTFILFALSFIFLFKPSSALACEPGEGRSCTAESCANGEACAIGHEYCVWDAYGNYWGGCVREVDNCSNQCGTKYTDPACSGKSEGAICGTPWYSDNYCCNDSSGICNDEKTKHCYTSTSGDFLCGGESIYKSGIEHKACAEGCNYCTSQGQPQNEHCPCPPSSTCDYSKALDPQCGADPGACSNYPGGIDSSHTVSADEYRDSISGAVCRYTCNDLGQRAGECGNSNKYGCSGSSCVQDNTNGTYTDSNCGGNCTPSNYCTAAGYYACTPGTAGSCILNGQTCTDYDVYKCNFNGQNYCSKSTCGAPCTSDTTPKYRCSGSSCVRDDANGTYLTQSSCQTACNSCGNGRCDSNENCSTCSRDCGSCPPGNVILSGRVTDTSGAGIAGVAINQNQDCGIGNATSNTNGYFSFSVPGGQSFCMRAPAVSGYTQTSQNYECQTAGSYKDPDICGLHYDMASDNSYNFTYSRNCSPVNGGWSGWGNCSNTCGSGTQTRTCTQPPPSCNGSGCSGSSTQSCTNYSGCTYTWKTSSWGGCSNSCGAGTQSRSVWCERPDGSQVADSYCGGGKPATSQSCTSYSTCTYSWQAGSWGACSVTCGGGGTRVRDVWCRRIQTDERVADSYCGGGKPNANEPCNQFPCVPTGLIGECGVPGTSATLNWNAASGATYYEVRVNGQTINTNSSGPLTVNNMIAGQNNEWLVRGCSASVCGGSAVGNVYCTPVSRNAQFVSRTCPPSFMAPGETADVQVTMKNTGNYRWSPSEIYRLGSQNPANNEVWGFRRVDLGSNVAPGSEYTFNFTVTAPNTQGKQSFQWQMLQENVAWFGDMSANCTDVTVSPQCPGGRGACGDYVPSPWTIGSCSGGTWVASHGTDNGYDKWCQNYVNLTRGFCYTCDSSFSPWIQAVGDVHSNERINASGGP